MTAPEKTAPSRAPASKVFLGWADDDVLIPSGGGVEMQGSLPDNVTLSERGDVCPALAGDELLRFAGVSSSQLLSQCSEFTDEAALTPISLGRYRIVRAVVPSRDFDALPIAHDFDPVRKLAAHAVDGDLFAVGSSDFHSTSLVGLTDIALMVGSIERAVLGVLNSLIQHAGLAPIPFS